MTQDPTHDYQYYTELLPVGGSGVKVFFRLRKHFFKHIFGTD
jgi:hypothetical protein